MSVHRFYKSIFFTILLIYFITILPIYFIFFILNNWALNDISLEKSNMISAYTSKSVSNMEHEVSRILDTQQTIMTNNVEIMILRQTYRIIHPYDLGKLVYQINNSLKAVQSTSSLVEYVNLYIPAIERQLSTHNYYEELYNDTDTKELYDSLLTRTYKHVHYHTNKMYLYGFNPSIYPGGLPEYIIETAISERIIKTIMNTPNGDIYWLMHNDIFTLTNESNLSITQALIESTEKNIFLNNEIDTGIFEVNSIDYMVSYTYSPILNCYISYYTPESYITSRMERYSKLIFVLGFFNTLGAFIITFFLYRMLKQPLNKFLLAFSQMEKGNLDVEIYYKGNNEFGMLFSYFNKMLKRLKNVIDQVYIDQINIKKVQLKQLQAQIGPHFLYNSINILTHSIRRNDTETALMMSDHLSHYFKYITNNIDDDTTLEKEFHFAKTYLNIQKLRFQDRIKINFKNIEAPWSELIVPRMILQPLIENCYKHGLKNTEHDGCLNISWYVDGNTINITIEDNGIGIDVFKLEELRKNLNDNQHTKHDGIQNVNQRLKLKYGNDYGLKIDSVESKYFKAMIRLPFERTVPNV